MSDLKESKVDVQEKGRDLYDKSDWYFTKVISILIAAVYFVVLLKDEFPFKVHFSFSYDSIFNPTGVVPGLIILQYLFIISMGTIAVLEAISIVFLVNARAKASSVCDIVSGFAGFITFAYYYGALLRFAVVPQDEGFNKEMYFVAGIWFLILGIAYVVKCIKNKSKLKVTYYLPAIVFAVLFAGIFSLMTMTVLNKTGFDNYKSDKFEYNGDAVIQADNYLRGAVSVDDELIFIQKLSDEEYGLVRMDSKGNLEILDSAAYIAESNLVVNGDYIYYLKYPGFWEDIYIGGVKNNVTTYFKLCVMNIATGEVREYQSDSFGDGAGKRLYQSTLIGLRDNKLFFVTRSIENNLGYELYYITLSDNCPDVSSVERYVWDLAYGGIFSDPERMHEELYNGLIVSYDDFDYLDHDGIRYELEFHQLRVWRGHDARSAEDYNVYNGTLYFIRYDKETDEYLLYKGHDLKSAEQFATVPVTDRTKISSARLIVSDTYLAIVSGEDIQIVNTQD